MYYPKIATIYNSQDWKIMLAQSQELEKARLKIQEKIINRIPEFERPLMEFTKILFEEWGSILVSASAKKPQNNESLQQENLNSKASQSVKRVHESSQQMEKSDLLSFSIHQNQKQDPNQSNFQLEKKQRQTKNKNNNKYDQSKSKQLAVNSKFQCNISVNHTGLGNVPIEKKQLSYDPMLVNLTSKMNSMKKEQPNQDKWQSMIEPGLQLAIEIDSISMVGRDFPADDRIELIEEQQMKHKLQLWLQHYKWIKKVNADFQSPIYAIDLTALGKGPEFQKNIQKLNAFIIEYESHEQYIQSIFRVREIRFSGFIKFETIIRLIKMKWYGLEEVGFKFDQQWFNWFSSQQLKSILSAADSMSKDKLKIKMQIDFLFNSYIKVISQINLRNSFVLSVINFTLDSYVNLVQIKISHPQTMLVHFVIWERNPKGIYTHKVFDYTLEKLKQSMGQEQFGLQNLIELQMDMFEMKCNQLGRLIGESIQSEINSLVNQQYIPYLCCQKYHLQNNRSKFFLEIFPINNFEILLQKFQWTEVQRVILPEKDFLQNWTRLVRNAKNFSNVEIIEIVPEKIDYEDITVEQIKLFRNLRELRLRTVSDFSKGGGLVFKSTSQGLMNLQHFAYIIQQLPNIKINFVNPFGKGININELVAKEDFTFIHHPIVNQMLDRKREVKKQNKNEGIEYEEKPGDFMRQLNSQIKTKSHQLSSQIKQSVIQGLPEYQRDWYMQRQAERMNRVKPGQATRMLIQQGGGLMNLFSGGGNMNQSMMNSSQGGANNLQNSIMNSTLVNISQRSNFSNDNSRFNNQSIVSSMSQFQKRKMEKRN